MNPLTTLLAALALSPGQSVTVKDLQGTWKGARFTEGTGTDPSQGVKLEITFKDNTIAVVKESKAPVGGATFTISADGKTIDATGTTGAYRGKAYLGILKIEGDTLTWCTTGAVGKDRPSGFTANPGSAHYLIVATRQK